MMINQTENENEVLIALKTIIDEISELKRRVGHLEDNISNLKRLTKGERFVRNTDGWLI